MSAYDFYIERYKHYRDVSQYGSDKAEAAAFLDTREEYPRFMPDRKVV